MKELVDLLISKNKTISTMESCTGGCLVNEITNIDNSSKVILFSAVTYSNEYKIRMGVSKDTIDKYSVYSEEVAKEMSYRISLFTNSDYGVGITGKLKKTDENNLSGDDDLVYISIYDKGNDNYLTKKIKVTYENRIDNKKQVINEAIEMLNNILK